MGSVVRRARGVAHRLQTGLFPPAYLPVDASGQAADDLIRTGLEKGLPFMAARLGRVELRAVLRWWDRQTGGKNWLTDAMERYQGKRGPTDWDAAVRFSMENNAGFFPAEPEYLDRFAERMVNDLRELDILGSCQSEEVRMRSFFPSATIIPLRDLEPYYHAEPWSRVLEGKTVLVIHPFESSIRKQYARRDALFANPRVLPAFELRTIKAVQSMGGRHPDYPDWFAALKGMQEQIAAIQFDVAIIGAGAYGFPLAAFVKRLGHQAIHLGGATQILFGIRGRRWDSRPFFAALMNEAWVRPLPEEMPENYLRVEDGCYW